MDRTWDLDPRLPVMEVAANLTIGVVGLIATLVSTYFGYVGVRGQIRRRHRAGPPSPPPPQVQGPYEVFVSYATAEAGTAERLAEDLRAAGTSVFLVRWVEPGLRPLLETERALTDAALGVLVFGPGTMDEPRIQDEYAALLDRVHEGGPRFVFVPARTGNVTLPRFAAIRQPVDLSEPGSPGYLTAVARLAEIARRRRDMGA